MGASESQYMSGFSFPGFTLIGDSVFLLATRLSTLQRRLCPMTEVAHFLCTIRRPLCRFLVYVGERQMLAKFHWVYSYAYVEPVAAFGGGSDVWGELPFVDGVRVTPPVQLGFPHNQARRRCSYYMSKGLPRIWVDEERCIQLQRQHFVFAFNAYVAVPEWSYRVRDYLACGGRPDAAHFTGLRRVLIGSSSVYFSAGTVRGKSRCAVGQFGAMLRDDISQRVFGREGFELRGSDELFNLHVPCALQESHSDRSLWPLVRKPSGEDVPLDPGRSFGKPDILDERGTNIILEGREHGDVHIPLPLTFFEEGRDHAVRSALPEDRAASSRQSEAERAAARRAEIDACLAIGNFGHVSAGRADKPIRCGLLPPFRGGRRRSPGVSGERGGGRRDGSRNGGGWGRSVPSGDSRRGGLGSGERRASGAACGLQAGGRFEGRLGVRGRGPLRDGHDAPSTSADAARRSVPRSPRVRVVHSSDSDDEDRHYLRRGDRIVRDRPSTPLGTPPTSPVAVVADAGGSDDDEILALDSSDERFSPPVAAAGAAVAAVADAGLPASPTPGTSGACGTGGLLQELPPVERSKSPELRDSGSKTSQKRGKKEKKKAKAAKESKSFKKARKAEADEQYEALVKALLSRLAKKKKKGKKALTPVSSSSDSSSSSSSSSESDSDSGAEVAGGSRSGSRGGSSSRGESGGKVEASGKKRRRSDS